MQLPAPIEIRPLAETELAAYKELRDAGLAGHPQAFTSDAADARLRRPESYRERLGLERTEGGVFTLAAWRSHDLAGSISCERDARRKVRHIGHIVGFMVRDDAQRRGIGAALLQACIAMARQANGLTVLTLTVTAGNLPASRLYERFGFVRCGRMPRAICVAGQYFAKDQMTLDL